jgi:hypothetical protein
LLRQAAERIFTGGFPQADISEMKSFGICGQPVKLVFSDPALSSDNAVGIFISGEKHYGNKTDKGYPN